jgi:hypothetical protein
MPIGGRKTAGLWSDAKASEPTRVRGAAPLTETLNSTAVTAAPGGEAVVSTCPDDIAPVPRSASVDASSQGSRSGWLRSSAAVRGPDDAIVVR